MQRALEILQFKLDVLWSMLDALHHAYVTPKHVPPGAFRVDKYWPPVGRVDNVWGDRNLMCVCPPVESYMEAAE